MKKRMSYRARVSVMILTFFAVLFLLPALREGDTRLWILAAAVPGVILFLLVLPSRIFCLDGPSVAASLLLCGLSIPLNAFTRPEAAVSQALYCAAALFFMFAGAILVRSFRVSAPTAFFAAAAALGMLSCPLCLSGVYSLAEGGIALLLFSVSAFLSLRMYLPALGFSIFGLLLLLLQQQVSAAVIWSFCCVLIFWTSSGSGVWSAVSLVSVSALLAGYLGFFPSESENQALTSVSGLKTLPLFAPEIPLNSDALASDSLFLLLGQEYGLLFLLFPLLLISLLMIRGASLAAAARKSFHASLACCTVLFFGLRTLVFLLSFTGFLPFPAGDFPLLTGSLPVLCAECFMLGLLSGVSARNENDLEEDARLSMLAR